MFLSEERDWGMPWPEFGDSDITDIDMNLRIYEYHELVMPYSKDVSEEMEAYDKMMASKALAKKALSERKRNLRLLTRAIIGIESIGLRSRNAYNAYTWMVSSMFGSGFNPTLLGTGANIGIFCIAYTFLFVHSISCL